MAGFEFGEALVCLDKVKIGNEVFKPGFDFPYQQKGVSVKLVEQLLNSHKVARKAVLDPDSIKELQREKVRKVIRNYKDGRVAVSWPSDEPIPEGIIDGRPYKDRSAKKASAPVEEPGTGTEDLPEPETEEAEDFVEEIDEKDLEDLPEKPVVEIVPKGSGWFDVVVGGEVVNEKALRQIQAKKLAKKYEE